MAAQYVDAIGGGAWSSRSAIALEDCYGELINLGSEVLTDIEWLINDKEYEKELEIRGIDHNTVNSLAVQHMMEIYKHKKEEGESDEK